MKNKFEIIADITFIFGIIVIGVTILLLVIDQVGENKICLKCGNSYNLTLDSTNDNWKDNNYPDGESVIMYINNYKVLIDGHATAYVIKDCNEVILKIYNIADIKNNDNNSVKISNINKNKIIDEINKIERGE